MTSRFAWCLALLLGAVVACDKTSSPGQLAGPEASVDGHSSSVETGDGCTSDNCVVPLADIEGVCAPTLRVATMDCPGTTVFYGPCGALTHVTVMTVGPVQDCYYDTTSGALVGGIVRSDAGFTKIAGTVPTDACPTTEQVLTRVCDHAVP